VFVETDTGDWARRGEHETSTWPQNSRNFRDDHVGIDPADGAVIAHHQIEGARGEGQIATVCLQAIRSRGRRGFSHRYSVADQES
jgi:hypothetical protein